jgi:hypothetical protein
MLFIFYTLLINSLLFTSSKVLTRIKNTRNDEYKTQMYEAITSEGDIANIANIIYEPLQPSIPISGFIRGMAPWGGITLRVNNQINNPPVCESFTLYNTPENFSKLMGSNTFKIIPDKLYNTRHAWTNGKEIISYNHNGDFGTWIVGFNAGDDSGYGYIKPSHDSFSPINLESYFDEISWHWLNDGIWSIQEEIFAVCNDDIENKSDKFYNVEYFESGTNNALHTFWIPQLSLERSEYLSIYSKAQMKACGDRCSYLFNKELNEWIPISGIIVIGSIASPLYYTDSINNRAGVVHIVNHEYASISGWRLTLKRELDTEEKETLSSWNGQEYSFLELCNEGFRDGLAIDNTVNQTMYTFDVLTKLSNVKVGDWVWIWYIMSPTIPPISEIEENTEILLQCVQSSNNVLVFKYYYSDRIKAMHQTVFNRDTTFFTLNISTISMKDNSKYTFTDNENRNILIQSAFIIGYDVLAYIRKYLVDMDLKLGGLSSCYLYHAAVSLPRSLVYAAEILCVLLGAKPVTMIQYESSSDMQWKFPLVNDLSSNIISLKALLGPQFEFDYRVNIYKDAETLIIFRKSREYLVNALVPFNQSQALHPMPYPNNDNPIPDWKLQIYNSWWNGYVLGYPERFIDSYCQSFHNGLDIDLKNIEIKNAKKDVKKYFNKGINKKVTEINFGTDPSISEDYFKLLYPKF